MCVAYCIQYILFAVLAYPLSHSLPRDAIVSSLEGVALTAQESEKMQEEEEDTVAVEMGGVIPSSEIGNITGT